MAEKAVNEREKKEKLFLEACEQIREQERVRKGIGTLGEKTVHAALKLYLEPDRSRHEIRVGNYVADIFSENGIIEIQTRNFNHLRKKLECFLKKEKVTIVYPIPYLKWISWIDEETGEITKARKSPKKGTLFTVFSELYKIKPYLLDDNLNLCIILMDIQEYRLLNGWSEDHKKGSSRFDRIPLKLVDEIWIRKKEEYKKMIPEELFQKEAFTSKEFAAAAGIRKKEAQMTLNILAYAGSVLKTGKRGNSILYQTAEK